MVGPRALFGRKSGAPRPVEELLANLSDTPKPKRKRAPRKRSAAGAPVSD